MFSFLEIAKQVLAPQHSLKARLHKHLSAVQPGRTLTRLHASEVTKPEFCARRTVIMIDKNMPAQDEYISTSLALTFAIGHTIQEKLVQWAADAGITVGDWRCGGCSQFHRFCKRPVWCHECGAKNVMRPVEVRFRSKVTGISGGIDMLADLGKSKLTLIEIKTMAADEFKKLVAPLAEHKLRTSLYLRLVAESDSPWASQVDTTEALILYATKGGYGVVDPTLSALGSTDKHSPFKEYRVQRDDSLTDPLMPGPTALTQWRESNGPVPGRICADPTSTLAQSCPARGYCFGNLYP